MDFEPDLRAAVAPSPTPTAPEKYRRPTDPRWLQVSKAEPGRWIAHDPPADGHYANVGCGICYYNPPDVSWEMHEDLQDTAEALSRSREELSARLGEGGAEQFDQVVEERDELIEHNDYLVGVVRTLTERVQALKHLLAQAQARSADKPKPDKRRWFR